MVCWFYENDRIVEFNKDYRANKDKIHNLEGDFMKPNFDYSHLNFEQTRRLFPRRLIPIGVLLLLYILVWMVLPQGTNFFLLLLLFLVLSWIATYGWQFALKDLIHFLQNLQNPKGG